VCVCLCVRHYLIPTINMFVTNILTFAVKNRSPGPFVKIFLTNYPDEVFLWVFDQRPLQWR